MPLSRDTRLPSSLPGWLKVGGWGGAAYTRVEKMVREGGLITVCEEAQCPNRGECWNHGTATFMLCGAVCTRACGFCATRTAKPAPLDGTEPERVAQAIAAMGVKHAVLTMVTRDDLPDGGAEHIAAAIRAVREKAPDTVIETLTSDFRGDEAALARVVSARPHVFNHNVETVERLTPLVRFRAQYRLSLAVLQRAGEMGGGAMPTKSGLMLGLGETRDELLHTMDDLLEHGVTMLTLGQYLRPTPRHLPVIRYLRPAEFDELRDLAKLKGFAHVAAGPLIRSSHHAANFRPDAAAW